MIKEEIIIRIRSFSPIVNERSIILILGSMPGEESLRKQEYYAHPRNQFWRIIYSLFELPVDEDYEEKVKFLLNRGIGLWDVIKTCYREGSLDSDIRGEKENDFNWLFRKYPHITHIFFNGLKAYNTFFKKVGFEEGMAYHRLDSTSPANTKRFEEKLKNWSIIKQYLK